MRQVACIIHTSLETGGLKGILFCWDSAWFLLAFVSAWRVNPWPKWVVPAGDVLSGSTA